MRFIKDSRTLIQQQNRRWQTTRWPHRRWPLWFSAPSPGPVNSTTNNRHGGRITLSSRHCFISFLLFHCRVSSWTLQMTEEREREGLIFYRVPPGNSQEDVSLKHRIIHVPTHKPDVPAPPSPEGPNKCRNIKKTTRIIATCLYGIRICVLYFQRLRTYCIFDVRTSRKHGYISISHASLGYLWTFFTSRHSFVVPIRTSKYNTDTREREREILHHE